MPRIGVRVAHSCRHPPKVHGLDPLASFARLKCYFGSGSHLLGPFAWQNCYCWHGPHLQKCIRREGPRDTYAYSGHMLLGFVICCMFMVSRQPDIAVCFCRLGPPSLENQIWVQGSGSGVILVPPWPWALWALGPETKRGRGLS